MRTLQALGLTVGNVLLLENVRYEPGETKNDPELAAALAALADVYVDDAFGAAHRAHASTEAIAHVVADRAAGLLLEREVRELSKVLDNPARPLVAVLGGAKVSDKIAVIDRFLELADTLLIGGAMCFPFLAAQGHSVGDSLCAGEDEELARRTLSSDAREQAGVFWNGPMGAFELAPFAAGTRAVAEAVAAAPGTTIVGGGDSVSALRSFGLTDRVTYVSTGGGASLELIEGRRLPGVEVLDGPETAEPAATRGVLD
jgi:phosphoglycerate kinase